MAPNNERYQLCKALKSQTNNKPSMQCVSFKFFCSGVLVVDNNYQTSKSTPSGSSGVLVFALSERQTTLV